MSRNTVLELIENFNVEEFFIFLLEKKLIHETIYCVHCGEEMKICKFVKSELEKIWRCMNLCCDYYQTSLSVLHCSFFHNSAVSIKKTLKIIYYLIKKINQKAISDHVGVSVKSICKIKKKLTSKINIYYENNPIRLGGINKCVQIDETKLNHNVKAHRGRSAVIPTWAITMVDTTTTPALGYAEVVPDRSSKTMIPIIEKIVRSGTIIQTDEWKSYNPLSNMDCYEHRKITHKYNFVDPITKVHTQHVESFNNKIKLDIKKEKGVRKGDRPRFLLFFMFLDTFKDESFDKMLELLKVL